MPNPEPLSYPSSVKYVLEYPFLSASGGKACAADTQHMLHHVTTAMFTTQEEKKERESSVDVTERCDQWMKLSMSSSQFAPDHASP